MCDFRAGILISLKKNLWKMRRHPIILYMMSLEHLKYDLVLYGNSNNNTLNGFFEAPSSDSQFPL